MAKNSDLNFVYQQLSPSAVWDIRHTLNKLPTLTVTDSNGDEVEGDVQYVNPSQVILKFSGAFSGVAILN